MAGAINTNEGNNNMKLNLLAVAIPALLVTGAANAAELFNKDGNKVDFYGRVKAANVTSIGSSDDKADIDGDRTNVRVGFLGETQISDNLVGYGRAEWEKKLGGGAYGPSDSEDVRYAYAGFKFADYGSLDYGKNDGVLKRIFNYTDVLPEFGGDSDTDKYGDVITALRGREKGVLTYRNSDFFGLVDGLNFAIQYQDEGSRKNLGTEGEEAFGVSLDYTIADTGLSVAGGYAQRAGNLKQRSYAAAIKYEGDDLYLAALYTYSKHRSPFASGSDLKFHAFEVVAQYGIDLDIGRITPSIAYLEGKYRNSADVDVQYIDFGLTYDFNRNMSAFMDYKLNLVDNVKDSLGLGVIYRF